MRLRLLLSAFALALCACFEGGGNSGSETTNGLTGQVRDVEGRPMPGARVLLLPLDHNPAEPGEAPEASATDGKGVYLFSDIEPGTYNLELSDTAAGKRTLVRDVTVSEAGTAKADATLGKPGALELRTADFVAAAESGYVYIPGTTAWAPLDAKARAEGEVNLASVPVGKYEEVLLVAKSGSERKVIVLARGVEAASEETVTADPFQTWAHSRKIIVDTKAMGVAGDVTDFPLLVRLDKTNFDFGQAQPNGQDLRITGPKGSAVPFQIERWDAAGGRAEIWARLDTVRGNDAQQAITLHWGRTGISSGPAGPAVFAPEAGFSTVYHLGEPTNGDKDGYRDATPNANHATAQGADPQGQVAGVVGAAKAFSGAPGAGAGTLAAAMPRGFGGNGSFTVSFWMRYAPAPRRQTIMDFGTVGKHLQDVHFLLFPDTTTQFGGFDMGVSGSDPAPWQSVTKVPEAVAQWAYFATVYDAEKGTLAVYVNGALADSIKSQPLALDAPGGLRIGRPLSTHPQDMPLQGALDEVRFLDRPLAPDRIRLDWATQKLP